MIVKPETVIAWHRRGFRLYWSWKSRHPPGRPSVSVEVIALIRKMSQANPRWGAPRIHGELLKLGFDLSEATVAKYMVRHRKPPSQTWRTFLANHMKDMVSSDFFVVPTVFFRVFFVFVILSHDRRRPVHAAVTEYPTAEWVAHQLLEAFPWDSAPHYLLRDRDGSYGEKFHQAASWLGIREVLTAPQSPWQNAYVERWIGSIRRECLDHVIVLNETGLRRLLKSYLDYYERSRTHLSLGKERTNRVSSRDRIQHYPPGASRISDDGPLRGASSSNNSFRRRPTERRRVTNSYLFPAHKRLLRPLFSRPLRRKFQRQFVALDGRISLAHALKNPLRYCVSSLNSRGEQPQRSRRHKVFGSSDSVQAR